MGKKEVRDPHNFQFKAKGWNFFANNLPKKGEEGAEELENYIDNKGWFYGSLINTTEGEYIIVNNIHTTESGEMFPQFWGAINYDILCLNSGIKDQDGVCIYENDVIAIENKDHQRYTNVIVIWNDDTNSLGYFEYNPQTNKSKFHNLRKKKSKFYKVLFNCFDSEGD